MSTAWWLLPWHRPQVYTNRHTHARPHWLGCKSRGTHICRSSLSIPHCCPGTFSSLARIIEAVVIYSFKAFLLLPLLHFLRCRLNFLGRSHCWIKASRALYWMGHDGRRCTAFLDTHWQPHYSPSLSSSLSLSLSRSLSVCRSLPLCLCDSVCFLGTQPIRWLWMQSPWLIQYKSKDLCEIIPDPSLNYLFGPCHEELWWLDTK